MATEYRNTVLESTGWQRRTGGATWAAYTRGAQQITVHVNGAAYGNTGHGAWARDTLRRTMSRMDKLTR